MAGSRMCLLHILQGAEENWGRASGAGAGTGISAKCEEAGGADLIVIYNSGRFRMGGRGSLAGLLPYADANAVVMDMAAEVIPVVRKVPVLAGVCGTDPFRDIPRFLQQVQEAGFAGVQNFPTVGLIDGVFRQNLEETGMGFSLEVDMIRQAAALGLLTTPYAFDPQQAHALAEAGADIVVAHVGLTTSGSIGAHTAMTLPEALVAVCDMAEAAREANPDVLVLCHGGPIAKPADAQYIITNAGGCVHGFYGASSMERLPVEEAITNCVREFKALSVK
ncbi:ToMV susceptible protein tm-1(GCR26) [Cymbomonas tetramitiformis]|uniref:ToMV susceptible protein tm-1(GCR26) n=1 Tax=Cymbomonas tetramitiformis TaxID=36881 RepID=A0AAE0F101_9CHLO|nr:ToMV susceptible protein tm-1(GCR26) [Cymbomonas tetramitiformis]